MSKQLLASSNTLEGLSKMLNEGFYSTTYQVHPDLTVTWVKGLRTDLLVTKKRNRYYCQLIK
jgi:hypothetical protein